MKRVDQLEEITVSMDWDFDTRANFAAQKFDEFYGTRNWRNLVEWLDSAKSLKCGLETKSI